MTKISIDEQIAWLDGLQQYRLSDSRPKYEAILTSLRELKRIKELMREPSDDVVTNCARRLLQWQDNCTDQSFDRLTWAGARTDARRVIAELYVLLAQVEKESAK
jgi:L-lactate utilization protein LutB